MPKIAIDIECGEKTCWNCNRRDGSYCYAFIRNDGRSPVVLHNDRIGGWRRCPECLAAEIEPPELIPGTKDQLERLTVRKEGEDGD